MIIRQKVSKLILQNLRTAFHDEIKRFLGFDIIFLDEAGWTAQHVRHLLESIFERVLCSAVWFSALACLESVNHVLIVWWFQTLLWYHLEYRKASFFIINYISKSSDFHPRISLLNPQQRKISKILTDAAESDRDVIQLTDFLQFCFENMSVCLSCDSV